MHHPWSGRNYFPKFVFFLLLSPYPTLGTNSMILAVCIAYNAYQYGVGQLVRWMTRRKLFNGIDLITEKRTICQILQQNHYFTWFYLKKPFSCDYTMFYSWFDIQNNMKVIKLLVCHLPCNSTVLSFHTVCGFQNVLPCFHHCGPGSIPGRT